LNITRREIDRLIRIYSNLYDFDPDLLTTIVWHESNFNPAAINDREPNGYPSYGLGQINATNFKELSRRFNTPVNETTILHPVQNLRAAAELLKESLKTNNNSIPWALSYYSSGRKGYYNNQFVAECMPYYYKLKIKRIAVPVAIGFGAYMLYSGIEKMLKGDRK
jgi:soluble lytic murein transglycosylase-like protein